MTTKRAWILLQHLRKVWVRVVSFAVLAVLTVVFAQLIGPLVPRDWTSQISTEAVEQVLEIMASSMLAVTTFSLSISVAAFSAAAQSATPRATALLQQDKTNQNVLSTFLGAFLFCLVGLVALNGGYYSDAGEFVLFCATVFVILLVVLAFLRWIAHLMRFGRMEDTLDRVETAASDAITLRQTRPFLGGKQAKEEDAGSGIAIRAGTVGYVQHVDMKALANCAEARECKIWVNAVPGDFVHENAPLAHVDTDKIDDETEQYIREAFTCDRNRTFDQDPRFGLVVMSEIARRALSPAVNDPGTAINVTTRLVRVLSGWRAEQCKDPTYDRIFVPPIPTSAFLEDAFLTIARDAGASYEVHLHVQKALAALADTSPDAFSAEARSISAEVMRLAESSGMTQAELDRLYEVAIDA